MSLRQLEYFVAVAEEGHVGRAARRCYVSQPPMSRQIRALEDELGASLFDRIPQGMKLSAAGQRFMGYARDVLAAADRAREALREDD